MAIFMPWRQPEFRVGWAVSTEGQGQTKLKQNFDWKTQGPLTSFYQSFQPHLPWECMCSIVTKKAQSSSDVKCGYTVCMDILYTVQPQQLVTKIVFQISKLSPEVD